MAPTLLVNDKPSASSGHAASGGSRPRTPAFVRRLTLALHVSVVLVSLSIGFLLFDSSLFSWHPLFMSVGYVLFMTEGVAAAIMFRQLDGPERVAAIQSHALMQLRAVVCIVLGFIVIYRNKAIHNKQHFMSTHAKFGLATLILTIAAPIGGAISFKRLGLIYRFPEAWHSPIKLLHRSIGVLVWLLAMTTIELALPHPAVSKPWLTPLWQGGIGLIVGIVLLLLFNKIKLKVEPDDAHVSKAV